MHWSLKCFPLFLLLVFSACGGGGGGTTPASVQAPTSVAYLTPSVTGTLGIALPVISPTVQGGTASNFTVTPALPSGVLLNATTGVISGTPTALASTVTYTVSAGNAGGKVSTTIAITINDQPPTSLDYTQTNAVYVLGTSLTPNVPSHQGGAVVTYTVSPAMPGGLLLDAQTGVITGTPTTVTSTAQYEITARNSGGSATRSISITVNDQPPSNLTYGQAIASYLVGSTIAPNLPASQGGRVVLFSIAPSLPTGLSLDGGSGVISGTPITLSPAASYQVTAINTGGSTSTTLSISVVLPPLTFTTQPFDCSVYRGTPGSFKAEAQGFGALTYQWQKQGVPIAGASGSTFLTPPVLLSDSGSKYSVVVSDTYGRSTLSAEAVLKVLPGVSTNGGSLPNDIRLHSAVLLNNGKVLVTGGQLLAGSFATPNAYLVDPNSGAVTPSAGVMAHSRITHTSTLLPNGKVLLVGGVDENDVGVAAAEIYDPSTDSFTTTGNLHSLRSFSAATMLPSGKVLISGGGAADAELYDSSTGTFDFAGYMAFVRIRHQATLLDDGWVLLTGGGFDTNTLLSAELYNPSTRTFVSVGNMIKPRVDHSATKLPDGRVLIAGGFDMVNSSVGPHAQMEIFDPTTNQFQVVSSMIDARFWHCALSLPNGDVLFLGGVGTNNALYASEAFVPSANGNYPVGSMNSIRANHTATLAAEGRVVIVGGGSPVIEVFQ